MRKSGGKSKYKKLVNTMEIAKCKSERIPAALAQKVLEVVDSSIKALTDGEGHPAHWLELKRTWFMATYIEKQGVVVGLAHDLDLSAVVLARLRTACVQGGVWQSPPCTPDEIEALEGLRQAHHIQLSNLSRGEYERVYLQSKPKIDEDRARFISDVTAAANRASQLAAEFGTYSTFPRATSGSQSAVSAI